MFLQFEQAVYPFARAAVRVTRQVFVRLIKPVRGDAVIRHRFHFFGTNLNLDRHTVHTKQRRVQRLIAVRFWDRNVIFETSRHGFIQAVHGAKHAIAGVCLIDDDSERVHVHNVGKRFTLAAHFFVDAVQVFFTTTAAANQPFAFETRLDRGLDFGDDLFAVASNRLYCGVYASSAHWIECVEAKLLELDAYIVHTKSICDRRINVERLARDAASFFGCEHFERAHIVKAVGDFNQNNPQVFGHCHRHLLKVFGLRLGAARESHLVELAHAVDEIGYAGAKLRLNGSFSDAGVFDNIVEHRGHQALRVHVHFAQNAGNG